MFTQCVLIKEEPGRKIILTSWIPSKIAIINQFVNIKDRNGWSGPWKVVSQGETREKPPSYIEGVRQFTSIKKRRKNEKSR